MLAAALSDRGREAWSSDLTRSVSDGPPYLPGQVASRAMSSSTPVAGVGAQLLDWAAEETIRQGRHFLRLDCVATNRRLRSYYEAAGFQARGDVEVGGAPGQRIDAGPRILLSRATNLTFGRSKKART